MRWYAAARNKETTFPPSNLRFRCPNYFAQPLPMMTQCFHWIADCRTDVFTPSVFEPISLHRINPRKYYQARSVGAWWINEAERHQFFNNYISKRCADPSMKRILKKVFDCLTQSAHLLWTFTQRHTDSATSRWAWRSWRRVWKAASWRCHCDAFVADAHATFPRDDEWVSQCRHRGDMDDRSTRTSSRALPASNKWLGQFLRVASFRWTAARSTTTTSVAPYICRHFWWVSPSGTQTRSLAYALWMP